MKKSEMYNLFATYDLMSEADKVIKSLCNEEVVFTPNYCIAGGAVRDSLLGREVKDIDVVVDHPEHWNLEWKEFGEGDFEYDEGQVTHLCDTGILIQGKPLQFIRRNVSATPSSMVGYHALALSNMFWYDGQLVIDGSALRDISDFRHTPNRGRWSERGFRKYFNKVFIKYPWPMRDVK